MRFSDGTGHKIVSTSSAETVGKVGGFVVDPKIRAVVALQVKKAESGDILRWRDVLAFGADAVTVDSSDMITEATDEIAALTGKDHRLVGKRVLSTTGDELGKVKDVEFDGGSGALTLLVLDDGELAGVRLRGVGSYAVVVTAQ